MSETEEEKAARLAAEEEAKKAAGLEAEEPELDDDGNPIVAAKEPWMEEEEVKEQDPDDPSKQVPVGKHVAIKRKLKGQISERDDEIEKLKQENADLLKFKPAPETKLVRPKENDFDTTDEYDVAVDKYNDDKLEEASGRLRLKDQQDQASLKAQADLVGAVDGHYERAAELIEKSGIKPEVYKAADTTVRKAVESIAPNRGDIYVDRFISSLKEGSEKVIYYLGLPGNQAALNKAVNFLNSDPSGIDAAAYLGELKGKFTNPIKPRSNAPAPASGVKGDEATQGAANRFKKKYDAVSAKNDPQAMYNAKKEARAAGVDVSAW